MTAPHFQAFILPPYQSEYNKVKDAEKSEPERMRVSQPIHLITKKDTKNRQCQRVCPQFLAQQTRHQTQFDETIGQEVNGGKVLGADGKVMKKTDKMGGNKICRVFLQFSLRQPVNQVAEHCGGREKQGKAGNRLQGAINSFHHHSNFEKEVDLFLIQLQFHVGRCSAGLQRTPPL